MRLTRDTLLAYPGFHGIDGLCHVRVYEQDGRMPVVIVGGLDDNPGTTITNAAEAVAYEIKRRFFRTGREFQIVEHYPDQITGRPPASFQAVDFSHADQDEPPDIDRLGGAIVLVDDGGARVKTGRAVGGDFCGPSWRTIDDIEAAVGCPVRCWPPGQYTARAVAGWRGELRRRLVLRRAWAASRRVTATLERA